MKLTTEGKGIKSIKPYGQVKFNYLKDKLLLFRNGGNKDDFLECISGVSCKYFTWIDLLVDVLNNWGIETIILSSDGGIREAWVVSRKNRYNLTVVLDKLNFFDPKEIVTFKDLFNYLQKLEFLAEEFNI